MTVNVAKDNPLIAICPYFTMFPLDFPYSILKKNALPQEWVLDPFCGRGTTNYASRILGLPSIGVDSSPVAVALSQAKLANASPEAIVNIALQILEEIKTPNEMPEGEFWDWAFHNDTLHTICRLREGLLQDCSSDDRRALRAIIMGALHGPLTKYSPSYLSNQSPRTYAPKPRYAVNFWKTRNLLPPRVDVLRVIEQRVRRYYTQESNKAVGFIFQGDSQDQALFTQMQMNEPVSWIVTSPPYYGMRTYIPDQWLRMWFVGGQPTVDYSMEGQVSHSSPEIFAACLRKIWQNIGIICKQNAQLVVRFGGINDRKANPLVIIEQSFRNTKWKINQINSAGFASAGKRQALHFAPSNKKPLEEYDIWASWNN